MSTRRSWFGAIRVFGGSRWKRKIVDKRKAEETAGRECFARCHVQLQALITSEAVHKRRGDHTKNACERSSLGELSRMTTAHQPDAPPLVYKQNPHRFCLLHPLFLPVSGCEKHPRPVVRWEHRSPRQKLERVRVGCRLGLDKKASRLREPWGCGSKQGVVGWWVEEFELEVQVSALLVGMRTHRKLARQFPRRISAACNRKEYGKGKRVGNLDVAPLSTGPSEVLCTFLEERYQAAVSHPGHMSRHISLS